MAELDTSSGWEIIGKDRSQSCWSESCLLSQPFMRRACILSVPLAKASMAKCKAGINSLIASDHHALISHLMHCVGGLTESSLQKPDGSMYDKADFRRICCGDINSEDLGWLAVLRHTNQVQPLQLQPENCLIYSSQLSIASIPSIWNAVLRCRRWASRGIRTSSFITLLTLISSENECRKIN